MHTKTEQAQIAKDMRAFLDESPLTADLEPNKDSDFLFHFEAERHLIVRKLLLESGFSPQNEIEVLDFGYLTGITQEFLHRAFPKARITVCDLPSSPIFADQKYLAAIQRRSYLNLVPCNISHVTDLGRRYNVIMLGEIIEHLDPTQVAATFAKLLPVAAPGCLLVVTTPNAGGFYNCYMTLTQGVEVTEAPIPNATHGHGHIHLWGANILRKTAEHFGWGFRAIEFYHGREGEAFSKCNRHWYGLKNQVFTRALKLIGHCFPKFRGCFVATFSPNAKVI